MRSRYTGSKKTSRPGTAANATQADAPRNPITAATDHTAKSFADHPAGSGGNGRGYRETPPRQRLSECKRAEPVKHSHQGFAPPGVDQRIRPCGHDLCDCAGQGSRPRSVEHQYGRVRNEQGRKQSTPALSKEADNEPYRGTGHQGKAGQVVDIKERGCGENIAASGAAVAGVSNESRREIEEQASEKELERVRSADTGVENEGRRKRPQRQKPEPRRARPLLHPKCVDKKGSEQSPQTRKGSHAADQAAVKGQFSP